MIIKLESAYKKMERQRRDLIQHLDGLSEAQLRFKPDEKSWNILQVCWHLIVAEENSLKYMQKKIKGLEDLGNAGIWSKLRLGFLNSVVSTKMKFKAPKVVELNQNDTANLSYQEVKEKWNQARAELKYFADKLDHKASEKMIFKHPFAGMFNIYQLFSFIEKHVQHHIYQIERIKQSPGFPKE